MTGNPTIPSTTRARAGARYWVLSITLCTLGVLFSPMLPVGGWELVTAADFNLDGKPDYVLFRPEHAPHPDLVPKITMSALILLLAQHFLREIGN